MAQWKGIINAGFTPAAFNAYVRQLTFNAWRPSFVVLHNTEKPGLSEWHSRQPAEWLRHFECYYRDELGWSAGPHLFIDDELIWVFIALTESGIHSPSWNAVSWGVEMVGNYDVEAFDPRVRANTIAALVTLHACIGLDPSILRFHKEDVKTTHTWCPGAHVVKQEIVEAVREGLRSPWHF